MLQQHSRKMSILLGQLWSYHTIVNIAYSAGYVPLFTLMLVVLFDALAQIICSSVAAVSQGIRYPSMQ